MIYVLLTISAVLSLVVLYKILPTRKIFMVICTILLVVFSASALIHGRQFQQEQITRERREELLQRQKIFIEWYASYQKDIDRLDRNWQLYHNILEDLRTVDAENFNAEAFYLRLKELEQESIDEQLKIHMLTVPENIGHDNTQLVESIIKKTQRYVDAQTQVISMSAVAANPANPKELDALKLRLNDIMIRESPEGLFTAQEISAIRDALGD